MPESFNNNDRIKFKKAGIQNGFIVNARESLGLTRMEFSKKLKVSMRTLADWTREEITISVAGAQRISKLTHKPIPKDHKIVSWRLHLQNAGKIGGRNRLLKYGSVSLNEKHRKEKWREWWNTYGKFKKSNLVFTSPLKIRIPKKSKELAEFIGILLGDGHIAKYQVTVTLSVEEKQYIEFVKTMFEKLFGVTATVIKQKHTKAVTIVVSRRSLVDFCQEIGFQQGNKVIHQVDIPEWIKRNKEFSISCIRGLVDTDGCFFTHKYISFFKKYSYLKIAFTSASAPLRESVGNILINYGFNVRMSSERKNNRGGDIRIDDMKSVEKYIREIGSHNQKHLDKIKKWKVALNGKAAVC